MAKTVRRKRTKKRCWRLWRTTSLFLL